MGLKEVVRHCTYKQTRSTPSCKCRYRCIPDGKTPVLTLDWLHQSGRLFNIDQSMSSNHTIRVCCKSYMWTTVNVLQLLTAYNTESFGLRVFLWPFVSGDSKVELWTSRSFIMTEEHINASFVCAFAKCLCVSLYVGLYAYICLLLRNCRILWPLGFDRNGGSARHRIVKAPSEPNHSNVRCGIYIYIYI